MPSTKRDKEVFEAEGRSKGKKENISKKASLLLGKDTKNANGSLKVHGDDPDK